MYNLVRNKNQLYTFRIIFLGALALVIHDKA